MHNITLLSSFHLQLGKCNSEELYKIIEDIEPEIIFEELPRDVFDIIYSAGGSPKSLEAITIKKYVTKYQIKHFPVCNYPVNETDLFNGADTISRISAEYVKLWNQQVLMTKQDGFSFLNSNGCTELLEKIHFIEESVLLEINNAKLSLQFKSEIELHGKRENEMLQNIYNYSKLNSYNQALFICGVEHRKPIAQKIQEFERKENLKLNWTFYGAS